MSEEILERLDKLAEATAAALGTSAEFVMEAVSQYPLYVIVTDGLWAVVAAFVFVFFGRLSVKNSRTWYRRSVANKNPRHTDSRAIVFGLLSGCAFVLLGAAVEGLLKALLAPKLLILHKLIDTIKDAGCTVP